MTAIGSLSEHGLDEPWPKTPVPMAGFEAMIFNVQTRDCYDEIAWLNPDQQIQASYIREWNNSKPSNAISQNFSWQAPIRSGKGWIDNYWLQFDLLQVKKIIQVNVGSPANSRAPQKVRLDYSNSGSPTSFVKGRSKGVPLDTQIKLSPPIYARFLRIVVEETNAVTENLKPVEMHKVKIFGCDPEGEMRTVKLVDGGVDKPERNKEATFTLPNRTVSSSDPVNYRHFAIDEGKNIIYMCDRNPYRQEAGTLCYISTDGGTLWIDQPKYIHNILGYSPKKGRMYLQDTSGKAYFSSTDGVRIELTDPTKIPAILDDATFQPAVSVPGEDYKSLSDNPVKFVASSDFEGDKIEKKSNSNVQPGCPGLYDGIVLTSKEQSLAKWTTCCAPPQT